MNYIILIFYFSHFFFLFKIGIQQSFLTPFDLTPTTQLDFQIDKIMNIQYIYEIFDQLCKNRIPDPDTFQNIVQSASEQLQKMPNLVEINIPNDAQLVVVGDLHGCFEALIETVRQTGMPDEIDQNTGKRNIYLFNGDYVDRGGSGYQIIFMLALFLVRDSLIQKQDSAYYPTIYVNRGNHESSMFGLSPSQNYGFKFQNEIQKKFGTNIQNKLLPTIQNFFTSMTIAVKVDEQILVVHGGVVNRKVIEDFERGGMTGVNVYGQKIYQINDFDSRPQSLSQVQKQGQTEQKQYQLDNLNNLNPSRFNTLDFKDQPTSEDNIWHQFLWSYERSQESAEFLKFNNLKGLICSHSAAPFHYISTFLLSDDNQQYTLQTICQSQQQFEEYKKYYNERNYGDKIKQITEIFTSPTNNGEMYVIVMQPNEYDAYNWEYRLVGKREKFTFIDEGAGHQL